MAATTKLLGLFLLALSFPSICTADVMVSLKNGRTVVADTCREAGDKLVCEKLGGTFEFSKKEVAGLSQVASAGEETAVTEPAQGEEKPEAQDAGKGRSEGRPSAAAEAGSRAVDPETRSRLEQIYMKRLEMNVERERLIKDREQLHEDVKNAGIVRTQEKFDSLKSRIGDLDTKIRQFNADVEKLNEEEKRLLGGQNK